ncbi:hypothetical protein [Bordetella sp. BOR01]|uniref:hypothetical protein n=1 Tax=Bordetella sp. BOR01 TaxID=2854779 RepID=UPI001C483F88|nr:hypothetical protein [Bordetella sp. BOR01]MBV7483430.1 hypothetical protein [Bordetella sp. BOR01]
MMRLTRHAVAAVFAMLTLQAQAAETLPAPVNGITFEEWTAGNARLANKQPLDGVLDTLQVNEAKWNEANAAFMKALQEGDPRSYTFRRYGEVFANPAVGRFAGKNDSPQVRGKLATFEDYARVQAHLTVATEAGKDPQEVLEEHDLNVYEFSQEARPWVQETARAAAGGDIEDMNRIREEFEAEYRARYGLAAPDKH